MQPGLPKSIILLPRLPHMLGLQLCAPKPNMPNIFVFPDASKTYISKNCPEFECVYFKITERFLSVTVVCLLLLTCYSRCPKFLEM